MERLSFLERELPSMLFFFRRSFMIRTLSYPKELSTWSLPLVGGCLLWIGSWIKIPFYPVPFTLQTFALFCIALTQTPKQAFLSTLFYLGLGTCGVPVFASALGPFWWMSRSAGFLFAFPICAYVIATLRTQIGPLCAVLCGNALLLCLGCLGLVPFVGLSVAFHQGFVPFLLTGFGKAVAAYASTRWKKE